ncbi:MAG: SRPBCC family protein [Terracidiphilus sp.]|jgi:hypothetical protein
MRIVLIVLGVLGLMVACVVVIGTMLPKQHVATRRAVIQATPVQLFALISGSQTWRPEVKSCELIDGEAGRHFQRETSRRGETVLYELQGSRPPFAIERRIATENLPYGGKWSFTLEPVDGGTKVRITEDGQVYNPVFRFVSRFVIGQTAMLDAYLKALGKAVGQDARIEN